MKKSDPLHPANNKDFAAVVSPPLPLICDHCGEVMKDRTDEILCDRCGKTCCTGCVILDHEDDTKSECPRCNAELA